ncbi:Nramp family divalent metal transporter [Leucobacter aridicollis]|uniref:Nramp family divalent metal transporter n=1 Tax=Leucobacter aridicollis TaxID=283878 RepID=UPI0013C4A8A3|nr:Nramp family divalent metal transporter [Leucobacter aridicollis]UTX54129.1 Nramp family divalent metal transporter [Leucobacter aridicollis]
MTSTPVTATAQGAPPKRGVFSSIGPAFITAALVFGPGSIATASAMGASFGYELIWVPVIATILMLCFVNIGVRIGLTTDTSILGTVAHRLTGIVAIIVGLGSFLVVTSFQAGNSAGTGAAGQLLFGGDPRFFAVLFTVIGLIFVWIPKFYPALEKLMVVVIIVLLVAMITTAVVSKPDLGAVVGGLVPSIPDGSIPLIVGLAATTFSIVGALYQIQLVREKGWTSGDFKLARRDAVLGTLILGALSTVIMIAAAATLNPAGIEANSPAALAQILEPIGSWAVWLFAIGLWAAAFSSLLGNSTIGGSMLAGVFKIDGGGLASAPVKACISLVIVLGGVIATVFGGIPIQLIITAQAVTIIVVPLIGAVMVFLGRHRDRGELRIKTPQLVLALFGLAFLLFLAGSYVVKLAG